MDVAARPIGRQPELATFDALCDDLNQQGATLLLTGAAGVGKSFLADEFARRAEERRMRVLRTWGTPTESALPFSGLHLLLHGLGDRIAELPAPQRTCLETAFGMSEGPPPGIFLAGVATLGLLSELSAAAPVLVVVDDVPWLDPASRSALFVALRRLHDDSVLAVLTARDDAGPPVDLPVHPMPLAPLSFVAANAVLDTRPDRPAGNVRRELLELAQGNPLALIELPAGTPRDGGGIDRSGLTRRLEEAFLSRFRSLSAASQLTLAVAAVGEDCTVDEVLSTASAILGRPHAPSWLGDAISIDLVSVPDDAVQFRHPLVRAAVGLTVTAEQRALILRTLVGAVDAPARSVIWRAELATGRDDALAAELETLAAASVAAHDSSRGLALLVRAVALSSPGTARADRMLQAAGVALLVGSHALARELLEGVIVEDIAAVTTARARWMRELLPDAGSALTRGDLGPAIAAIDDMRTSGGTDAALGALVHLASIAWDHSSAAMPAAPLIETLRAFDLDPDDPRRLLLLAATQPVEHGDEVIDRIRRLGVGDRGDPDRSWQLGYALNLAGDVEMGAALLERAVEGFRSTGRLDLLPHGLMALSWMEYLRGRFSDGRADADECARLAVDLDDASLAHASAAVGAWWDALDGVIPAAPPLDAAVAGRAVAASWAIASGMAELAAGDPVRASRILSRVADPADPIHHPTFAVVSAPDAVDAALAAGNRGVAVARLADLEETGARWGAPMPLSVIRYVRMALADSGELDDAARELAESPLPLAFLDARAHLLLGSRLRRAKRIRESREQLRAAAASFATMPAPRWAARAYDELRATGERVPHDRSTGGALLSPQERRVAEFAASGLTNRQIAERIFLSPRTVEAHLRTAFRKLDISDRGMLRSALDHPER